MYPPFLRSVRILRSTRTAMQAGARHPQTWRLEWDVTSSHRWINPIMGWSSSGDAVQATNLRFPNLQSAIRFAERQGYAYSVEPDLTTSFAVKSYADNYRVQTMNPLKIAHTK